MRRFILLAIVPLFTMACFGVHFPGYDHDEVPAEEPLPTPETGQTVKVPLVITGVEVLEQESDPLQIQLHVTGHQTDGCEYRVQIEQRREGNEVFVEIYRDVPIAATCIQTIIDHDMLISLEDTFNSGENYTIYVNDFTLNVEL